MKIEQKITTLLMYEGQAEEAMRLYTSLFSESRIEQIDRYGAGEQGVEGAVKHAIFSLAGQTLRCIDSPVVHPFGFTPAVSLFVDCETEGEVDALFSGLADGGAVLMPLDEYPFSRHFAWVTDRFGVSWQLSLS